MAKISKSYILTPQGHVMSAKCEEPLNEFRVQVWLLYHHLNLNYWTLFVSRTELPIDRRTDKQTDGRMIRLLDAPGGPFRPGAYIKTHTLKYARLGIYQYIYHQFAC